MKDDFQLTRTDVSILKFLIGNVTKEFSIKGISDAVKVSYPSVRGRVLGLRKRGIISIRKINPTQTLCRPDTANGGNVAVFSYIEFLKREERLSGKKGLKAVINDILDGIKGNSFTLLLFGSHASGRESPSSDVDLLFLIPSEKEENGVTGAVSTAGRLTGRKIHAISMTYSDFFESLKKGSANLPREVLENHVMLYGAEAFYRSLVIYGQV